MTEPTLYRPSRSLHKQVAIVTGAGSIGNGIGNGRASAILFAEDGCSVVCVDRDISLAQRTVEMIQSEGKGKAIAVQADVTSEQDCARIVATAVSEYGRVDILFNCVGVGGPPGTAVDVDMVEFAKGLEINVSSMVKMAKYVIPEMIKNVSDSSRRGYRGSIVNMSSVAGLRGGSPSLLYPVSKSAILNLTRSMAAHHAADGIRVNCVCPGMVYTPMMYANGMSEEARESRKNRSLLKVEGSSWDVAGTVRFLAGEEARWITGTKIVVDAGASCSTTTDLPKGASVGK